jgi:hypothetical protein
MNMYELILNIIDQKGPTSIPSICEEVNRNPIFMQQRSKPVQLSQIKSVLTRKSDLFLVHNDVVSLLPEKELIELNVQTGGCGGPLRNVKVDFIKKDFTFFEWNFDPTKKLEYEPLLYGSMDEFKQEIYRLKIWNWDLNYEQEGIILDGMCWSISLETRTKTYKSQGLQTFPKEWARFCRALSKLTGKKFS